MLERHPQIGFRMLESLGVDPVAEWVLHHHERWDGTGYPDRLGGDADPARRADPLRRRRVRRDDLGPRLPLDALTAEAALDELERCAGTQFDPEIVSALADELALDAGRARERRRARFRPQRTAAR